LRLRRADKTLYTYETEIGKMKAYQVKLRELEKSGSSVVPEEQELDLIRAVDTLARASHLQVSRSDPRPHVSNAQTNRFFEEQYQVIQATADNEELVNFLVSLTTTNVIRVKGLNLKLADASATRLDANMTLVASYQRSKPAAAPPSPQATRPATNLAAAKPAKTAGSPNVVKTNKPGLAALSPNVTNATPKSRMTNLPFKKK
jgi:hypothetical protein